MVTGARHTPGPWKVQADPEKEGLHPFHDHRFVATEGTDLEAPGLDGGAIICEMRDTTPADARLIAAAPGLLDAAERVLDQVEAEGRDTGTGDAFSDLRDAIEAAR